MTCCGSPFVGLSCISNTLRLCCYAIVCWVGKESTLTRSARIGLVLFTVYLAMYGGFVFLNAFSPQTMETTPIAGVNLAILYGFGLIIAALVMALLYGWLCRADASDSHEAESDR